MTSGSYVNGDQLVGILSDAHGNGPAFDRAIEVLRHHGALTFWFLGDAVGYIPSTSVLASLNRLGNRVNCIMGNHEQMLLAGCMDAGRDTIYQLSALKKIVSVNYLSMIAAWKVTRIERFGAESVLYIHGSPSEPTTGYVYPITDLSQFKPDAQTVFMGHSHYPFIRESNQIRYVNVGSCGLPRDDGRFGSAALYDPITGEARIVRFDITVQTEAALATSLQPVHPSVYEVLARRTDSIFGDLL